MNKENFCRSNSTLFSFDVPIQKTAIIAPAKTPNPMFAEVPKNKANINAANRYIKKELPKTTGIGSPAFKSSSVNPFNAIHFFPKRIGEYQILPITKLLSEATSTAQ